MLNRIAIILLFIFYTSHVFADTGFAAQPEVKSFIKQMVRKHHFDETYLTHLFDNVKFRPKIIKSIKAPLEQKPWFAYQMLFVTEWRIREGVKFWNKYHDALARAERTYGVPASIIVATIGIETKYGTRTGDYPVIDALANLAFSNTPRAGFFRKELEEYLLLTRENGLNPLEVKGSYAGAIGQPQFMPSSYRHYAVNFSGYPKIDLSHNEIDVIGSIANYYQKHGWQWGEPVVVRASAQNPDKLPKNDKISLTCTKEQLNRYGIVPKTSIPKGQKVYVIQLRSYLGHQYWLGFPNFEVIKRYNNSDLYAMAVYQLSYYIVALKEKTNSV